ncbi:DUF1127 domain-containing protein [Alloyangia pacifica]|uniref:DUF1127 domain-containing protein n=1 Tax=Alloyangia pacifica TaxID=311180 RepID=UPI001CFE35AE|nr:hypothetical protein [Alloyangia pacifica]
MPRDIALPRARIRHRPLRRATRLARFIDLLGLARQRRKLAELDDHLLRDLGLTRRQALEEAKRGFWDAPGHWRN